jgi:hypothetical protein
MPLSTIAEDEEARGSRSTPACNLCRRRKIRCSRELPRCAICEQTSQQCAYPERISKPGPKLGSTQVGRRRKHTTCTHDQEHASSPKHRSRLEGGDRSASLSPMSTSRATGIDDLQSLYYIVHPSHESCSPDQAHNSRTVVPVAHKGQTLLISSCSSLGIDSVHLDTM